MVNTAILNAVKMGRDFANEKDFSDAYDRLTMGIGRKNMHMK
jgi:ATP-dependent metalloprotease